MTTEIIAFGEILVRLSGPMNQRLSQSRQLDVHYGGAEANVVASLAQWGHACHMVTVVPGNPFGEQSIRNLNSFGVNTEHIIRNGDRLGLYFLEHGASVRPSKVVYDRKNSSFATNSRQNYDWAAIFKDKQWFHFSGINAAVSNESRAATLEAIKQAKLMGLTISCDTNFRAALWSMEEAQSIMPDLMEACDLIISNVDVAAALMNISVTTDTSEDKMTEVAQAMQDRYGPTHIALTQREVVSASINKFQGGLWSEGKFYNSRNYELDIVDRVGSGDAFAAGIIHGLLKKDWSAQESIDYATAAGAFKHTIPGDVNLASEDEIQELATSKGVAAIKR